MLKFIILKQSFYEEVSTPLLADIVINYLDNTVDPNTVTDTSFPSYFKGSEIIVAGKLKNDKVSNLISQVSRWWISYKFNPLPDIISPRREKNSCVLNVYIIVVLYEHIM